MEKRDFGEMVSFFNRKVSEMNISKKCKMELLGMITAIEIKHDELLPKWIPFTMRELTTDEKEEHPEWDYIMDCKLPDDGEEILVSNGKFVWSDTFINDGDDCYLDGYTELDGCAWMPLPEPWRGEE